MTFFSWNQGRYRTHVDRLYRALGEGMACAQYIESGVYLAALGARGGEHEKCSARFFGFTGLGSRLRFTDELLRRRLEAGAYSRRWRPLHDDLKGIVEFRNALAHFEVYFISDEQRTDCDPPTQFNVIVADNHMNANVRIRPKTRCLSIEWIERNNEIIRKAAHVVFYFVVDHFRQEVFEGRGLLPLTEAQLAGFRRGPRPPEFVFD